MRLLAGVAFAVVFAAGLIFLCGRLGSVAGGPPAELPPAPRPAGPYVDDPLSGRSFNLSDYERLTGRKVGPFSEAPMLAGRVRAGALPPVAERLPAEPLVLVPWERPGRYGGTLRWTEYTIGYDHYLRHLNEADLLEQRPEPGVAVCFKWTEASVQPGILERWSHNADANVFTLTIRRGLKWSDGVPVTTEDVRFCIEDVLLNREVTPILPRWARWGGRPLELEVVDGRTFRLRFARSYGLFERLLATMRWGNLMLPAHYLKQFHIRYTPLERLKPLMDRYGYDPEEWGRFYLTIGGALSTTSAAFVPERMPPGGRYPTLDAWVHLPPPNPGDYILERNPYYYKVDPDGRQLPYIDRLARTFVSDIQVQNLKVLSGETDLQFQFLRLSDYPMLKRGEARGGYHIMLLPAWQDYMLIYPLNIHPADAVMRPILGDVRFRRALSLALNREEIREAMFLGMGRCAQLAPLPDSPWYREGMDRAWARYDPAAAARLLDEMGLPWDAEHRFRLTRDGKPFTLRIDYYDVSPTSGPGAELAKAYWEEIGIRTSVEFMDGARFWLLRGNNEVHATVWWGDGASPAAQSFISGFLMTRPWEQWYETDGAGGEEPPGWVKHLFEVRERMHASPDPAERIRAGREIFEIFSEQLWTIGAVADVPIPFVHSRRLGNVVVAQRRRLYAVTVAEAAEQWFFQEPPRQAGP